MMLVLLGAVTLWILAILVILSICRAAARADEHEAGRRIVQAGRRSVSVGMAAAVASLSTVPGENAEARRAPVCHNGDVPFEAAPAKARRALLCEIDRVRAKRDLWRLRGNALLDRTSKRHAADMVRRHYFSHETPGGATLSDRARRTGYVSRSCSWQVGEVLAWGVAGRSTAEATVKAWMDSPDHRRILVSRRYDELGSAMVAGTPMMEYPSGVTVAAVFGRRQC